MQLDESPTKAAIADITTFLASLTAKLPDNFVNAAADGVSEWRFRNQLCA